MVAWVTGCPVDFLYSSHCVPRQLLSLRMEGLDSQNVDTGEHS